MAKRTLPDSPVLVYRIVCDVNGKSYIGVTRRTAKQRWDEHRWAASTNKTNGLLQRAIRKHGAENFTMTILYEAVNDREAQAVERAMIASWDTLAGNGYNLTTGGEKNAGRRASKAARENMSAAVRKQWEDPEFRARMTTMLSENSSTEEHKTHLRALAAEMKGKPRRAESVEKGRASLMGHVVSAETRAKIGAKSKGRIFSDEARAKMSASRMGHTLAEDGRRKVSEAAKARWADPEFRARATANMKGRIITPKTRAKMSATRIEMFREKAEQNGHDEFIEDLFPETLLCVKVKDK